MPETTNPALLSAGRGGRCEAEKGFVREADSTTSTPADQDLFDLYCRHCAHFLSFYPKRRRSLCRWSGEHVNGDWPCSGCWGFQPLNGGGDAA